MDIIQNFGEKNEYFLTILTREGIAAAEDFSLPETLLLPMLEVDRNKTDEDLFTKGLLGENMERTEDAAGNTVYQSPLGKIVWSTEGKVQGAFSPANYEYPRSEREMRVRTAQILETCGISSTIKIEANLEEQSVSSGFDTAGAPVFNRNLRFVFGASEILVDGWWTFQTPYMVQTNNYVVCEPTDAILTLLKEEPSVNQIDAAAVGYILLTNAGRQISIVPCCRITTEQGVFFVDSLKNTVLDL